MLEEFINNKYTIKSEDRDCREWHKGRKRYAVWAIEVEDEDWLSNLEMARELLQGYLLQGQQRKMHITLFACGFFDECAELIELQTVMLKKNNLKSFRLALKELDSFLSAPFFAISDITKSIDNIRKILDKKMKEDRQSGYCPHLTVGLYNDEHSTRVLSDIMRVYKAPAANEILVKKISLMTFDTKSIYSPLRTEFEIELEQTCK